MIVPLVPPAVLLTAGETAPDAAQAMTLELDALQSHLQGRQANWTVIQTGREWTPAQELQHVMAINAAGLKAVKLLLSDRELRPGPQVPGVLNGQKKVSPEFAKPDGAGLTWVGWPAAWAAQRQAFSEVAPELRATPGRTLWHPYYGQIDALDWWRSLVLHLRGHREALQRSGA